MAATDVRVISKMCLLIEAPLTLTRTAKTVKQALSAYI